MEALIMFGFLFFLLTGASLSALVIKNAVALATKIASSAFIKSVAMFLFNGFFKVLFKSILFALQMLLNAVLAVAMVFQRKVQIREYHMHMTKEVEKPASNVEAIFALEQLRRDRYLADQSQKRLEIKTK